jgi:hypothetical protein
VVLGDQRLDEFLAQRLQARDRAGLVGPDQPAVADHISGQNRREPAFHARGHAPASNRAAPIGSSNSLARIRASVDAG